MIFCNLKNDFSWEEVLEYLTKYPEKINTK